MLFLHNGADHRLWDCQVEHFRKTHDAITPDLIGFGRPDKPDLAYTLDLYVRFLKRCIEELGLAPVTLVDAGVGSATSLRYAYTHPENVRALVLINMLCFLAIAAFFLIVDTYRPLLQRVAVRAGATVSPVASVHAQGAQRPPR